ncbi:MAG: ABC transporter ATP-binding protein [Pseudomonadota bacterium]
MPDAPSIMLSARQLTKKVSSPEGSLTILDGVSFDIAAGSTAAIIGPSGAGKSTLLALLAGLDTPTSGGVTLDGVALNELDEDGRAALRARKVGFMFQSFHLVPSLTAVENIMLPMELAGDADAPQRSRKILSEVGLAERAGHYPNQLSGGEKQRIALARAYASQPSLLFADEPTGNLDKATGERVIDLMFSMNADAGTTLVLVTHDESLAARCDERLVIDAGRLQAAA